MSTPESPLQLAVVGHTNTGKTSLMRTLLRDAAFGEVKNAAATTRHVETAGIGSTHATLVQLYDTPGLEDAGGVLDWLDTHTQAQADGIDRIRAFLAAPAAQNEFSQEAKVLRQLAASDAALYVVDAREPVLPKYKDELAVLSLCARPIMPVFNFTQTGDLPAWRAALARRNLHVSSSFDTVAFDFEGEMQLWQNLATMLPDCAVLPRLQAIRRSEWKDLDERARRLAAAFLLDAAAYAYAKPENETEEAAQAAMQATIKQHEHHFRQSAAALYRFYQNDWNGTPEQSLRTLTQDPFDPELLLRYGIRTGTGAAAGALIGLGVDAFTLGTSLGLGSALGGVLGGLASNWDTLMQKISGTQTLHIGTETLAVLAHRAAELLNILQTRGHAAQNPIALPQASPPSAAESLPEALKKARSRPNWSSLNGREADSGRQQAERETSEWLASLMAAQRQPEN